MKTKSIVKSILRVLISCCIAMVTLSSHGGELHTHNEATDTKIKMQNKLTSKKIKTLNFK